MKVIVGGTVRVPPENIEKLLSQPDSRSLGVDPTSETEIVVRSPSRQATARSSRPSLS